MVATLVIPTGLIIIFIVFIISIILRPKPPENAIFKMVNSIGGEVISIQCLKSPPEGDAMHPGKFRRYDFRFKYKINGEVKEGWVRIIPGRDAEWEL